MAVAAVQTGITEDDLLRLSAQDKLVEVVNGEIVEMTPVGLLHHFIGGILYRILDSYVVAHRHGFVFMDGLIYVLSRNPKGKVITSRVPDVSFVRNGRISKGFSLARPFPGAPDLAVEVISPDETADSILDKVRDYLAFGSEQVWLLYPKQKELHQHTRDQDSVRIYREGDTLEAAALFPNLQIAITDLFTLPDFD